MIKLISPNFSDIFPSNIEIGKFPDGDSHVVIPQLAEVAGQDVLLFHRLYPKQNTNLVVFLFIIESLRSAGAKSINAVVPYLPYARQDKSKLAGELPLAYSLCRTLASTGLTKLITFDCHFLNKLGLQEFAGLKIENLSMGTELVAKAREYFKGEYFEIIGPDDGANYLVSVHGGQSLKKVRKEYEHGKVGYRDIHEISGQLNVEGKNVLILDDIISSGSTMLKALEKVLAGKAKAVACTTTHGLFLFDCINKMEQFTSVIFSSNTIEHKHAEVSISSQLTTIYGK